jgi:hypothetical protein
VTRTARLKVGGWAAIAYVVLGIAKLGVSLIVFGSLEGDPSLTPLLAVELVQALTLAVAVAGLHEWFAAVDPRLAGTSLAVGIGAAAIGVIANGSEIVGISLPVEAVDVAFVVAQVLGGGWFLLAGTLVGRSDSVLQRSGWLGQVGGFGLLLIAAAYVVNLVQPASSGLGGVTAFAPFLVIFGLAFLVRLGRFAASGTVVAGPI